MANYGIGWVTFYSPFHNYIVAINEAARAITHREVSDCTQLVENLCGPSFASCAEVDARDTIFQIPDEIKYNEEHELWYAEFGFEFAWQVHPSAFHVICHDYFKGQVKFVYVGTESGGDYFENTDVEGLFYPQRFRAEIQIGNGDTEEEECRTKEELVIYLRQTLHDYELDDVAIDTSLTPREMEYRIREMCDDREVEYGIISVAAYDITQEETDNAK